MRPEIKSKKKPKTNVVRKGPPKKATKLADAQAAVAKFEEELEILQQMNRDWKNKYPKAHMELKTIKEQQDLVVALIGKAKPLVAAAKETIGDFKCTRKWSSPKYNDDEITKLISNAENAGEILDELFSEGVIKTVVLDSTLAVPWIAKRPEYSEFFKKAWEDKKEMTPSVSVPKL